MQNTQNGTHFPLWQTCEVLCPWALFHETAVSKCMESINFTYLCATICVGVDFLDPCPFCFLTLCSLSKNEISDEGMCALAGALQVNQSLQEFKWVQLVFKVIVEWWLWAVCISTCGCQKIVTVWLWWLVLVEVVEVLQLKLLDNKLEFPIEVMGSL